MSEAWSFSAKLISKKKVSDDAYSFYFERPRGFEYLPGQYVKMTISIKNPDERGNSHFFTIAASPTEKDLMITTRILESSFKKALGALSIGSEVQMRGPYGAFVFEENDTRPRVFLAGGIGITPCRSIMIYTRDKKISIPITLIASFGEEKDVVYRDELSSLANESLKPIFVLTSVAGRVDEGKIKQYIKDMFGVVYYTSGPLAFVEAMQKLLESMGIPDKNIIAEDFPGY